MGAGTLRWTDTRGRWRLSSDKPFDGDEETVRFDQQDEPAAEGVRGDATPAPAPSATRPARRSSRGMMVALAVVVLLCAGCAGFGALSGAAGTVFAYLA